MGPALPDRSTVFATTSDGQVVRRYRTKAGAWAWEVHGWPLMGARELRDKPTALAVVPSSAGLLLRPTAVAFSLQAGVIGVLQVQGAAGKDSGKEAAAAAQTWTWTVVDVPAGVDGGGTDSKSRRRGQLQALQQGTQQRPCVPRKRERLLHHRPEAVPDAPFDLFQPSRRKALLSTVMTAGMNVEQVAAGGD